MALRPLSVSFAIVALFSVVAMAGNSRFDQFFPYHRAYFTEIRDKKCAAFYAAQQTDNQHRVSSRLCTSMLDCMLNHTVESVKGNMSSGLVSLGLMPTILSQLGSYTDETALLSRRRPLLSLLLSCGSPAIYPLPTFAYQDPLRGLKARNNILVSQFAKSSSFKAAIIVFTEYILVLAAIANVVTASYYMGFWTVSSFSCTSTYLPALWVTFSVFIRLGGMLALTLRTESGWTKRRSVTSCITSSSSVLGRTSLSSNSMMGAIGSSWFHGLRLWES